MDTHHATRLSSASTGFRNISNFGNPGSTVVDALSVYLNNEESMASDFKQENCAKPRGALKEGTSLRCGCGSLLARLVSQGVELKCRRCKRQVILPLDGKAAVRISM